MKVGTQSLQSRADYYVQSRQNDDLAIEDVTHATAHNRCLRIINHGRSDILVAALRRGLRSATAKFT